MSHIRHKVVRLDCLRRGLHADLPGGMFRGPMAPVIETNNVIFNSSAIHGRGGFAKHDLRAGTHVIEYVGRRITWQQSLEGCRQGNEYIFHLDEEHHLDGSVEWNPARFLNHSCAPNCEAENIEGRIWIVAKRDIKAAEELTFDYGFDLEDYRDFPCRCGVPQCCGYIVAEGLRGSVQRFAALAEMAGTPVGGDK